MRTLAEHLATLKRAAAEQALRGLDPHAPFWLMSDSEVESMQRAVVLLMNHRNDTFNLPSR